MAGNIKKVVLDTCALIWWSLDPANLSPKAKQAIDRMEQDKNGLISSISIWEIAIKIKNNKLDLGVDIDEYIATLKKSDVIRFVPIDEEIWLDSVRLSWDHRDPADRVIVAMAQANQAPIITADRKIADFYSSVLWYEYHGL
jgi:PIN domain nuclease of toxin-antitoxin system